MPVKEALYRITQEALHNIVKHAHASQVGLSLTCDKERLRLEIKDNGQGFDPSGSFPGHLGLHSMCERTEQVGGQFTLESSPGRGARVLVEIPIRSI